MATAHDIEWRTPVTLWPLRAASEVLQRQPALLSFDADRFMEDLAGLSTRKLELVSRIVGSSGAPAELLMAVHGKLHLVAASLICGVPGWPDHAVSPAHEESVGFVLRKLTATGGEVAWVRPSGPWVPADSTTLASGEEVHPLGPLDLTVDGRGRRVHIGSIPTACAAMVADEAGRTPAAATRESIRYQLRCLFETSRCRAGTRVLSSATPAFTVADFFSPVSVASLPVVRMNRDGRAVTTFETMAQYGARLR